MGLALFPFLGIVNRIRGGMLGAGPVRWLYVVSVLIGLVLGLVYGWRFGLGWSIAYLAWGSLPWGRWYDLGRLPENYARPGLPAKWSYEWAVERLAGQSDHARLFLRHLVLVPALAAPALLLNAYWLPLIGIPAAALMVGAYEAGWQLVERGITRADKPIDNAEWLAGFIWGALIYLTI